MLKQRCFNVMCLLGIKGQGMVEGVQEIIELGCDNLVQMMCCVP